MGILHCDANLFEFLRISWHKQWKRRVQIRRIWFPKAIVIIRNGCNVNNDNNEGIDDNNDQL